MTWLEIVTKLEWLTKGMRGPFAALTFAACFFCLISILLAKNKDNVKEGENYVPWLACIFIAACILRVILYPHHAGPMNDDLYVAQSARLMMDSSFIPINNFEPSAGWPFIASLFFWITGPNQYTLYYTNSIIGCLSVLAIFFMVYGITGRTAAGLAAAAFLAVHPLHAMWSTCGAGIVPALFFIILSLASLFWFFRLHHPHYIFLSIFAASFAAQISAENILLLIVIPPAIFFLCKELFDIKKIAFHMLAPVLLAVPSVLQKLVAILLQHMTTQGAGAAAQGADTFITQLIANMSSEISRIAASGNFSMVLIGLAAAGLVLGWKNHNKPIIFFTILCVACIVFMSSISEHTIYREKYSLYTSLCFLVIGSFCVHGIIENQSRLRIPVLLVSFATAVGMSAAPHIANLNPDNEYFYYGKTMTETIDRIQTELPKDAVLIVEDPAPFQAVTSVNTISPLMALAQAQDLINSDKVYFLMDISTRNMNSLFFDVFEMELEYPIPLRIDQPGGRQSGLYKVITLNLEYLLPVDQENQ